MQKGDELEGVGDKERKWRMDGRKGKKNKRVTNILLMFHEFYEASPLRQSRMFLCLSCNASVPNS